jgi:hypothetical protein
MMSSEPPQRMSWIGWGVMLVAFLWIVAICFTIPIGADRYGAPRSVKWLVTAGHLTAVVILLFPQRGKGPLVWVICGLISAFALMGVSVLWFWN